MTSLAPADELVDPFARPRGLVWTDGVQSPFVAIERQGVGPGANETPPTARCRLAYPMRR